VKTRGFKTSRTRSNSTPEDSVSSPSSPSSDTPESHHPRRISEPPRIPGTRNRRASSITVVPEARYRLLPAVFTPPTVTTAASSYHPQTQLTPPSPLTIVASAQPKPLPLYNPPPPPRKPNQPACFQPTRSAAPPPPPHIPAPVVTMTTIEMPGKVDVFHGDYSKEEEPTEWFMTFQLSLPSSWNDDQKVERFQLHLVPNSYADEWFNNLSVLDTMSMTVLRAAFFKRWPPTKKPKWSKAQQKERIRGHVLQEEDIGTWIAEGRVGDYGQNVWAVNVMRLALSMGDVEGMLIEYAIEGIPTVLKEHLTGEYDTWEEFLEGVRSVPKGKLSTGRQRIAENRARDDAVAILQQQIAQMPLRAQTGTTATARPSYRATPTTLAGNPLPTSPNIAMSMQRQYGAPVAPSRGAMVSRPPLTRALILEKVAATPQRPNTEAGRRLYDADIENWHRTYGNEPPSLDRPYPIRPGTATAGTGECFSCGTVTEPPHTGHTCTSTTPIRPYETRWRQIVTSMLRRVNQFRPTPMPVQYIWPMTTPPQPGYAPITPPVYMVATSEEWGAEQTAGDYADVQEANWNYAVQENYPGLPHVPDQL
jgi:hypothetical protein